MSNRLLKNVLHIQHAKILLLFIPITKALLKVQYLVDNGLKL
jgi:hypothetical protein